MSRELDALVAEKVMGWWQRTHPEGLWVDWHRPSGHYADAVPAFSTDIAAAWEVVEKIHENCGPNRWCFRLEDVGQATNRPIGAYWCATFEKYSTYYSATELTAPEAICRAALAAVGVEE